MLASASNCLRFLLLIAAISLSVPPGVARAQEGGAVLRVGVYEGPPFVVREGDGWTGMAVQLWEGLADQLGLTYTYVPIDSYAALVAGIVQGDIDVAVANITITEARHRQISFTQPWFDAGLRLMVGTGASTGFAAVWEGLRNAGYLRAYGWLALIIVLSTGALTLFDRATDPEFPRRWLAGLAESFYGVMSIATSGKVPSRKNRWGWPGRIVQALWLVCGVAVLAYVTSTVTSVMTTLTLTGQINSIADMSNRVSGVLQGSTAEEYALAQGLRYQTFTSLPAAAEALTKREVDAVIGDAPVLEYFLRQNPDVPARVTGAIFKPEKYAFGVSPDSQIRRAISVSLTAAQESGDVEALRLRYFGSMQ